MKSPRSFHSYCASRTGAVIAGIAIQATLAGAAAAEESVAAKRAPSILVIEVIGRNVDAVSRQTGSVVIITEQDLSRIQPVSTEDVLRRVAGINTKSEEETSIVANIGLRGLSASESKSLILEDGVPVAPGLFIGNERYFNPRIQRMERIEILKGSAALRYGPSTIGGVVATYARSDGFMDKGYEMTDVMLKGGMAVGDNQQLGVKFSYHENEANISYRGLLLNEFDAGVTDNPAPDDYFLTDRIAFDANHELTLGDRATLTTLVYWSEMTRDYWRYDVDTPASNAAGRWVYQDTLTGNNRPEPVAIQRRQKPASRPRAGPGL
ncbi:MAG: TonB-dependent receptor plug domain-containing protein [Pseudomonadales bacterium]